MIINKNQLYEISSLIQEGLLVQKSATEAKKKYLGKVKSTIVSLCNDNHEILPSWVETMDIPVLSLSEANIEIVPSFPDIYIITTIELLKDIRSEYYTKENLIELQK